MMQGICQFVKDIAGLHTECRSVYTGMAAERGCFQQIAVYEKLYTIFRVVHQSKDGGRAGCQLQQLLQCFF